MRSRLDEDWCPLETWGTSKQSDVGRPTLTDVEFYHQARHVLYRNSFVATEEASIQHFPLRWRHNDHAGVSNHQPHGCLLNRLYRRTSKKTSKLRVTGLCAVPAQMASYAENVSIWWRHHVKIYVTPMMLISSLYNLVCTLEAISRFINGYFVILGQRTGTLQMYMYIQQIFIERGYKT